MKFIQHDNQNTILYISGMFAGSWIWDRSYQHTASSKQIMIEEPLCAIAPRVETIVNNIVEQIEVSAFPITIVGNSLGSLIGLGIAKKIPNSIEQVLISGSAGFESVNLGIQLKASKADAIASELIDLIFHNDVNVDELHSQDIANSFGNYLRNIIGLIKDSERIDGRQWLEEVKCPVKAIWGRNDIITPFNTVESVFKQLKIDCEIVDSCGHSPMYEKPIHFANWVNQCITEQATLKRELHKKIA